MSTQSVRHVEREQPQPLPRTGLDVSIPPGAHAFEVSGHSVTLTASLLGAADELLHSIPVSYISTGRGPIVVGAKWLRITPPADFEGVASARVEFTFGRTAAGCETRVPRRV